MSAAYPATQNPGPGRHPRDYYPPRPSDVRGSAGQRTAEDDPQAEQAASRRMSQGNPGPSPSWSGPYSSLHGQPGGAREYPSSASPSYGYHGDEHPGTHLPPPMGMTGIYGREPSATGYPSGSQTSPEAYNMPPPFTTGPRRGSGPPLGQAYPAYDASRSPPIGRGGPMAPALREASPLSSGPGGPPPAPPYHGPPRAGAPGGAGPGPDRGGRSTPRNSMRAPVYIAEGQEMQFNAQGRPLSHICNVCSRAFDRPSALQIHERSHTGERPFPCPWTGCVKSFTTNGNMVKHSKICPFRILDE